MDYRIDSRVEHVAVGQHDYTGSTGAVADQAIRTWHDDDSAFTTRETLYGALRGSGMSRGSVGAAVETLVADGWLAAV